MTPSHDEPAALTVQGKPKPAACFRNAVEMIVAADDKLTVVGMKVDVANPSAAPSSPAR